MTSEQYRKELQEAINIVTKKKPEKDSLEYDLAVSKLALSARAYLVETAEPENRTQGMQYKG